MKGIGIGVSDFKALRIRDNYFIDKSLFIKNIIDNQSNEDNNTNNSSDDTNIDDSSQTEQNSQDNQENSDDDSLNVQTESEEHFDSNNQ